MDDTATWLEKQAEAAHDEHVKPAKKRFKKQGPKPVGKPKPAKKAAKKTAKKVKVAKKTAKKVKVAKRAAKPARKLKKTAKPPAAPVRTHRVDLRLTKAEKVKLQAKAKATRRTVTSIMLELIEKMR